MQQLYEHKILYRVSVDHFNSYLLGRIDPILTFERHVVIKETTHTYLVIEVPKWLSDADTFDIPYYSRFCKIKRFYKRATNRFAWETKEAAMSDFNRKQTWRRTRLQQELEECDAIVKKSATYYHGMDKNYVF
jgi:hypothetical protein